MKALAKSPTTRASAQVAKTFMLVGSVVPSLLRRSKCLRSLPLLLAESDCSEIQHNRTGQFMRRGNPKHVFIGSRGHATPRKLLYISSVVGSRSTAYGGDTRHTAHQQIP